MLYIITSCPKEVLIIEVSDKEDYETDIHPSVWWQRLKLTSKVFAIHLAPV